MMDRRSFLRGILAAAVAPAFVKTAGLLMPVKPLVEIVHDSAVVKLIEARMNDASAQIAAYLNTQLWTPSDEVVLGALRAEGPADGGRVVIPMRYESVAVTI